MWLRVNLAGFQPLETAGATGSAEGVPDGEEGGPVRARRPGGGRLTNVARIIHYARSLEYLVESVIRTAESVLSCCFTL